MTDHNDDLADAADQLPEGPKPTGDSTTVEPPADAKDDGDHDGDQADDEKPDEPNPIFNPAGNPGKAL